MLHRNRRIRLALSQRGRCLARRARYASAEQRAGHGVCRYVLPGESADCGASPGASMVGSGRAGQLASYCGGEQWKRSCGFVALLGGSVESDDVSAKRRAQETDAKAGHLSVRVNEKYCLLDARAYDKAIDAI